MATVLSYDLQKIIRGIPGYDPFAQAGDCWFDEETAAFAIDFIQTQCSFTKGTRDGEPLAGQPFLLELWQKAIIANLFGWKRPDGLRRYRECLLFVARKNGKALALDTPIATPGGWTTMGKLSVGDELFDESGCVCRVVGATDVMTGHDCYRVRFSDGSTIVADADHLWKTKARQNGKSRWPSKWTEREHANLRTTREIKETLYVMYPSHELSGKTEHNHAIPVGGAIELPKADLPIPPYVLGAWLGDGTNANAGLTCSYSDQEIIKEIVACGVTVKEWKSSNKNSGLFLLGSGGRTQVARNNCLQASLRSLNLLRNKHIPLIYLRASREQRHALLQGLIDTDGSVSRAGQVEFCNVNERLYLDTLALLRTLGYKPTFIIDRARLNGKDCGPRYRIQFWAYNDRPCCRLTRKANRLKPPPASLTRSSTRKITAVDPVESVPVRCIQVDSPFGMFLAGEAMIPTHNSELAAAIIVLMMYSAAGLLECLPAESGAEIYGAAGKRDQTRFIFDPVKKMILQNPNLKALAEIFAHSIVVGDASYKKISSEATTEHGGSTFLGVIDELHAQPNPELVDVISTSMASREQPLLLHVTTSDYERDGSVCNTKHDYAVSVRDGLVEDPAFLPIIYEASKEDDWTNEEVWKRANPNWGVSVRPDHIARECKRAQQEPTYENEFKRLHLNIRTEQAVRWMPMDKWDACNAPLDMELLKGRACWAGLDLASIDDMASLVLAFEVESEYWLLPFYWCPEDTVAKRGNMRTTYQAWANQGSLNLTPEARINYDWIRQQINELAKEYRIEGIGYDPYNAEQLRVQLQDEDGITMIELRQGFKSMNEPMKAFMRLVLGGQLRHGGHKVLRWNASNIVVMPDASDNHRPLKNKSTGKIDGIVAAIMAIGLSLLQPIVPPSIYETRGVRVLG
ncbi:hypothetical protein LCGC14_1222480 [marine sediment metagenome]|uniref:DOD-type homing endonuclease domain-containing protein n=1 Tax=marine sediment metagenome TaxID=412755 RepID=A0A0F9NT64_9ZZZZ